MKIRVTDKDHEFYGKEIEGSLFYYDVGHTGDSDDLYVAKTPDGKEITLLTRQIDEDYYNLQCLDNEIKELGANVGDKVRIIKSGSGCMSNGWKQEGIHEITKISSTGCVVFDNGAADMFRPKVKKVS